MYQLWKMALVASIIAAVLMVSSFLVIFSGGELFAQQRRGTISVDSAVALPLTSAEGNQVRVVMNYDIEDESLIRTAG